MHPKHFLSQGSMDTFQVQLMQPFPIIAPYKSASSWTCQRVNRVT